MPAYNTAANQSQIDLTTNPNAMIVTREPIASNTAENIAYAHVVSVIPVKIQTRPLLASPDYDNWKYRFDQIIVVSVELADGNSFKFDIQEITNQAGWTPNLAGQQQCVSDISAQL